MAGQIEIRLESMDVQESLECYRHKRSFNKYVDKIREEGGQTIFVCVHAQVIKDKNCPRKGEGVKKWQNSVHVVIE